MRDLDGTTIDDRTVARLHELCDKLGAPADDDMGNPLSLRFRLIALAYEKEHASL